MNESELLEAMHTGDWLQYQASMPEDTDPSDSDDNKE